MIPKVPQDEKDLSTRMREARLLILEMEGTVTDGRVWTDAKGGQTLCTCRADEIGLEAWHAAGGLTVVTSRENLPAAEAWCRRVGAGYLASLGDKARMVRALSNEHQILFSEMAYMGADLDDLAPLVMAGVPACPASAHAWVRDAALVETRAAAGAGAVRELVDLLLADRVVKEV